MWKTHILKPPKQSHTHLPILQVKKKRMAQLFYLISNVGAIARLSTSLGYGNSQDAGEN